MLLSRRWALGALATLPMLAPARGASPLMVFAAASLQTALGEVGKLWTKETGESATFSFAASSALARQIEQGAPADLFLSADEPWMDWLAERKLIRAQTRRRLLGNRLVLIAAADDAKSVPELKRGVDLRQVLGDSRLAMGEPDSVPAGRYGKAALTYLGMWDSVSARVAGVANVRAALALVARGEAKYGLVYETDAKAEPRVRIAGVLPEASHPPIIYPAAVLAASAHADAQKFLDFLAQPGAAAIFRRDGFTVLG